jgi:hypothetical protein
LRAVIDKRERFWNGARFSIGEGSRSAPWLEHGGRKHGLAGSAISANAPKDWRSASMAVSLPTMLVSTLAFCVTIAPAVSNTTLRPFMIRMDSNLDLLIERNAGLWSNRCGEAPVRGNKRREQKASYPPEILKHWHDRQPQRA